MRIESSAAGPQPDGPDIPAAQPGLTAAQEAEAQLLAQRIARAAGAELLQIARTLVASDPSTLFGVTEFQVSEATQER